MSTVLAWALFKIAQKVGSCPSEVAKYSVNFVSNRGKNEDKIKSGYRSNSG